MFTYPSFSRITRSSLERLRSESQLRKFGDKSLLFLVTSTTVVDLTKGATLAPQPAFTRALNPEWKSDMQKSATYFCLKRQWLIYLSIFANLASKRNRLQLSVLLNIFSLMTKLRFNGHPTNYMTHINVILNITMISILLNQTNNQVILRKKL